MRGYVFLPCTLLLAALPGIASAARLAQPATPSQASAPAAQSISYEPVGPQTASAATDPQNPPPDATTDQSTPQPDDLPLEPE